jgi:hypothetical protein
MKYFAHIIAIALMLSGCSAMSTLDSPYKDTNVVIRDRNLGKVPVKIELRSTSFGNYEFKAVRADGTAMYGILPLKFNGGQLAVNILLFAPASFFNLREVYPYYEFDLDRSVVKFRETEQEDWREMKPKPEEIDRAKKYFGDA